MVTHLSLRLFLLPKISKQYPLGISSSMYSQTYYGFWLCPLRSLKITSLATPCFILEGSPFTPIRQVSFACCRQQPCPLAIFPLTVFLTHVIESTNLYPHCSISRTVKAYLALMAQTSRTPLFCSFGTGICSMNSSESESYWMATPREGWEVESFHGGSIMITSNKL